MHGLIQSRHRRRRLAHIAILALLLLALFPWMAACGEQPRKPLAPPDMSHGLLLAWVIGREGEAEKFEPTRVYRFEMTPRGRFTYEWRGTASHQTQWTRITGAWSPVEGDERRWTLRPDDGRDAVDPDDYPDGSWPRLHWTTGLTAGLEGPALSAKYFVPFVDPETRRIESSVTFVGDPRLGMDLARQMADRLLEDGR